MPNRKSTPLLKCGHCKFARYCNRDCQKSAWEAHKPECAAIKRVFPNVATDQTRLAARLFWKKSRNEKNNTTEELPISVEVQYVSFVFGFDERLENIFFHYCTKIYSRINMTKVLLTVMQLTAGFPHTGYILTGWDSCSRAFGQFVRYSHTFQLTT